MNDSQIFELLKKEQERQLYQLRMIPSENYVSEDVMKAVGSVLMNKYSEGQVRKRFYQGQEYIDQIEALTKERALEAFGLDPNTWGVNVQAVTGSVANMAVYSALIEPHDKIMGMFLYDGGHLSHGWKMPGPKGKPVSMSAKFFTPSYYYFNLDKGGFDYEEVAERAKEEKPKILISGGTAYPLEIEHEKLGKIANDIGALYMADIAHEAGLVAAGVNKSPFEYADIVTMTTRKTLRGPIGSIIFARDGMIDKINSAVFPGLQGGPQNHSIAGIGVALYEAMQPEFKIYAEQVVKNAKVLAKGFLDKGYDLVSGGTEKHLILLDLRNKELSAKKSAKRLEDANIIVNKNTVPGETNKPWNPSGLRLGTPSLTSRGMKEEHMEKIVDWFDEVLINQDDESIVGRVAKEVRSFAEGFGVRK